MANFAVNANETSHGRFKQNKSCARREEAYSLVSTKKS